MRVPQKTLIIQLFSILKMSFIYDYGKYRGNVNRKGLFALKKQELHWIIIRNSA